MTARQSRQKAAQPSRSLFESVKHFFLSPNDQQTVVPSTTPYHHRSEQYLEVIVSISSISTYQHLHDTRSAKRTHEPVAPVALRHVARVIKHRCRQIHTPSIQPASQIFHRYCKIST